MQMLRRAVSPYLLNGASLGKPVVNGFHRIYYSSETWRRNTFLGYPIMQCPLDLHLYQELIFSVRPEVIIQTGVANGGSLLFLASMLDLANVPNTRVIGIDIKLTDKARTLTHPRISMVEGSSVDKVVLAQVSELAANKRGIVILDSDHSKTHVAAELQCYPKFVAPGAYLVVEDTNINGHPVCPSFGPGPYEATNDFVLTSTEFVRDDEIWQKNLFSMHTWLRRTHAK